MRNPVLLHLQVKRMKDQDNQYPELEELESKVRFYDREVGFAWEDYIKARATLEATKLVLLARPVLDIRAPEHESQEYRAGYDKARKLMISNPLVAIDFAVHRSSEPQDTDEDRGFFAMLTTLLAKLEELGASTDEFTRISTAPCPVLE